MYVRVRKMNRTLGAGVAEGISTGIKLFSEGAQAYNVAKGGGGGSSAPAQKSTSPNTNAAPGSNFLESLSNTELAIGGVSILSLALALTR